jgi:hypothetical protein
MADRLQQVGYKRKSASTSSLFFSRTTHTPLACKTGAMRFHRVALLLAALTGANARALSSRYPANPLDSRAGPASQLCASFISTDLAFPLPPGSEVSSAIFRFCASLFLFISNMPAHLVHLKLPVYALPTSQRSWLPTRGLFRPLRLVARL